MCNTSGSNPLVQGSNPCGATMDKDSRKFVDDCSGIYYFKNILNGKYYIGQAINIRKRLIHHISNIDNNRYDNPLYRAIHKYGYESFEFGILQRIDNDELFLKDILDFWEKYYIVLYNSFAPNGYNQTLGGDTGVLGLKMTIKQRKKVSENSKKQANDGRYKVLCYDTLKNVIIQCPTLKALGLYLGINIGRTAISNILIAGRYIIARDSKTLHEKINIHNQKVENLKDNRDLDGKFRRKVSVEAIQDIINGMREKDWLKKYNLSRGSYGKTKQKLVREGKMTFTRVYTKKVSKEDLESFLSAHDKKEAAEYFKVNISTIYDYIREYNLKGRV